VVLKLWFGLVCGILRLKTVRLLCYIY